MCLDGCLVLLVVVVVAVVIFGEELKHVPVALPQHAGAVSGQRVAEEEVVVQCGLGVNATAGVKGQQAVQ